MPMEKNMGKSLDKNLTSNKDFTNNIAVIGAGGHAKVIIDAILAINSSIKINIYDDKFAKSSVLNVEVKHFSNNFEQISQPIHVAIGDNAIRKKVFESFNNRSITFAKIIHPNADISQFSTILDGVFVAKGAIIGPNAEIAKGSIINHGAIVDHDCKISSWCHIAPNATLGGNVLIEKGTLIGAGSVVLPGLKIGAGSIVGAGAVVTKDVGPNQIVMGVPAKLL